jgi:dolichyl-phosphate beta-glucosyltransferase
MDSASIGAGRGIAARHCAPLMPDRELTLVVPCYNEASRLDAPAFLSALENSPWLHLLFVNDGSTDDTARVLEALEQRAPHRISVLSLPQNMGKAEAVRHGLRGASARSAYCGFWDADLSAPLSEVDALFDVFAREPAVQWVWAIRLRSLGRSVTRGALRHYCGRVFATVASSVLGVAVYDTQCGAKLFRVTPLLTTVLSEPFISRWVFDVELLSRATAALAGTSQRVDSLVFEQPLRQWHHRSGSKVRPIDALHAFSDLLKIRRQRQYWIGRQRDV